jgi:Family of unknown function (DUF5996)
MATIEQAAAGRGTSGETWPALPYEAWGDTCATLHMWTQVVGKIRLALAPSVNHWWQVPLYVDQRGLTTSPIPYGERTFQIDFDFVDHQLKIQGDGGATRTVPLGPRTVADFHREVMAALRSLRVDVEIWTTPVEVPDPIPFEKDTVHAAYDPAYAHRFWRALVQADRVMKAFRGGFTGKCSPVHFFWGSFDLAVTRFSGRVAPPHPGAPGVADRITREAYSHEVSSAGFWPGNAAFPTPIFYAYAYPEPPGFKEAPVRPQQAFYSADFGEFMLKYDDVRAAASPDDALLAFLQSTYDATADLGRWDRAALERGRG